MKYVNLRDVKKTKRFVYEKRIPFDLEIGKFQVVYFEYDKPIKAHHHKITKEIFLILSGKGVIGINDNLYNAKYDDCFLIEPGDSHSIIATSTELVIAIFKPIEAKDDIYWDE